MTGVSSSGIEAAPVITNLDDDPVLLSLDANLRGGCLGVSLNIRQRFSPDGEQLVFNGLGQPEPRPRPAHVDGQPVRAQGGGLPGQRCNQPIVNRVAPQLEHQGAHLGLHAPR